MAPKKLRDQLKKGQQSLKEPTKISVQEKPKYVPTLKTIGKAHNEDTLVRTFFESLQSATDPVVVEKTARSFGNAGYYGRKTTINRIFDTLPPNMEIYQDFIEEYLEQQNRDLSGYFDFYVSKPYVAVAIRLYQDEQENKDEEIQRLEDIMGEMDFEGLGDEDEIMEVVDNTKKKY